MSKKGACCVHLAKGTVKAGAQNHNEREITIEIKEKLDKKVAELHDNINQLANSGVTKTDIDKLKLSKELQLMVYDAMGIKSKQEPTSNSNKQTSVLSIDNKSEGNANDDASKIGNDIKIVQAQINELQKDNGRRIGHVFPQKSNLNEIWNISMDPGYTDTKFPKKDENGKLVLDGEGKNILTKSNVQAYIEEVQGNPDTRFNVNTYKDKLMADFKASHGFEMRSNGVPLREAIIVGNELTTMDMIKDFCKDVKETYGMQAIHIAIHHDEGHVDRDTEVFKENYHAHIIFDCVNHDNNYSMCRLERKDTAFLQTMLSKSLGMERGEVRSEATHFDGIIHGLHEYEKVERNVAFSAVISARVNPNIVLLDAIKAQAPQTADKAADDNKTAKELRIAAKELGLRPALIASNVVKDEVKRLANDRSEESVQLIDKLYKKVLTKEDKLNGIPKEAPFEDKVDFIIKKVEDAADKSDKITREQDVKIFRPIEHANDILNIDVYKHITDAIIDKADKLSANEKKVAEIVNNEPISLNPTPKTERSYDIDLHYKLWNTLKGMGGDPSKALEDAVNNGLKNIQEEIKSANGKLEDTNKEVQEMHTILTRTTDFTNAIKKDLADIATAGGGNVTADTDTATLIKSAQSAVKCSAADLNKNIESSLNIVGTSKAEMLKDEIHRTIDNIKKDPNSISQEQLCATSSMADKIGIKPSNVIADNLITQFDKLPDGAKRTVCSAFHLPIESTSASAKETIRSCADTLDNSKNFSPNNEFLAIVIPHAGFRLITSAVLNKVDELAESAKNDPKAEEQIDTVARFLQINMLSATQNAVEKGQDTLQKKYDKELEGKKAEIKDCDNIIKEKESLISSNQATIDEQEVLISRREERAVELSSSIKGLEDRQARLKTSLGDNAKPSSLFDKIKGVTSDAVENVISKFTKDESKILCVDLYSKYTEVEEKYKQLSDSIPEIKQGARLVGVTEGYKKAATEKAADVNMLDKNFKLSNELQESKAKVDSLTKQNKEKDTTIKSVRNENSTLRNIIDAMMPSQPKAIQLLNKIDCFSLRDICNAIKDKVIKCFTGNITHPDFPKDPFYVFQKDVEIKDNVPEPLIDNKPLCQLAEEQHIENQQKQSRGQGL